MESVIFTSTKKSDLKLLSDLAKKIGVQSRPLSKREVEDWSLAQSINSGMKTPTTSRESVMKVLKRK